MYKSLQYKHAIYFTCVRWGQEFRYLLEDLLERQCGHRNVSDESLDGDFCCINSMGFQWDFNWGYHVVNGNVI